MYKAKYIEKDNQLYLQLTSKNGKKQFLPITEERATLLINDEGELKRDIELSEALNDPRFFPAPVEGNEIEELLDQYLNTKNKAENWSNILKEMNLTPLKQIFKTDRDKTINDILNDPKVIDEEKIRIKKAIEIMNNLGIGADGDDKVKDLNKNMENVIKTIEKLTPRLIQQEDKTIAEVIEEEDDKVIKNLYKLTTIINKKVDENTKINDLLQLANNTANELNNIIGSNEVEIEKEANTQEERLENMEKQLEYIKILLEKPINESNNSTTSSRLIKQPIAETTINSSILGKTNNKESEDEKSEDEKSEDGNTAFNTSDDTIPTIIDEITIKKEDLKDALKPSNEFLTIFNEIYNRQFNDEDKDMFERLKTVKKYDERDYRLERVLKDVNSKGRTKDNELNKEQFAYFIHFVENNKPFTEWEDVDKDNKKYFGNNGNTYNSRLNIFKNGFNVLKDDKISQDLSFQPEIPKVGKGLKRLLTKYTKKK